MGFKYIMLETRGRMLPVIFPEVFVHAELYEAIRMANRSSCRKAGVPWEDPKVVSAGQLEGVDVDAAHGGSETLNLSAHPEDKRIINTFQYGHGIGFERQA